LSGEGRELRLGFRQRHAVAQLSQDDERTVPAAAFPGRVERRPDLDRACGVDAGETRRRDADDGERPSRSASSSCRSPPAPTERAPPQRVADHGAGGADGFRVGRDDRPPAEA
jgi:hypothetical protein